jgi:hypothetical protein
LLPYSKTEAIIHVSVWESRPGFFFCSSTCLAEYACMQMRHFTSVWVHTRACKHMHTHIQEFGTMAKKRKIGMGFHSPLSFYHSFLFDCLYILQLWFNWYTLLPEPQSCPLYKSLNLGLFPFLWYQLLRCAWCLHLVCMQQRASFLSVRSLWIAIWTKERKRNGSENVTCTRNHEPLLKDIDCGTAGEPETAGSSRR